MQRGWAMRYSSSNLREPGLTLPLRFPVKVVVEYRPGGALVDYAPQRSTSDPEAAADEIVRAKGWDQRPGFQASDVWVDAAIRPEAGRAGQAVRRHLGR